VSPWLRKDHEDLVHEVSSSVRVCIILGIFIWDLPIWGPYEVDFIGLGFAS
jgi:hypothetical protein